jgi:hypothetical protein
MLIINKVKNQLALFSQFKYRIHNAFQRINVGLTRMVC